jgi:hypothetical protein
MNTHYFKVSPNDVSRLVDKIEDVIEGEDNVHVSVACLVIAILAQKRDLDPEELPDIVKGVSEYLIARLVPDEVKH